MQLIILNSKFEKLGIIENASVIWHMKYNDVGEFQIRTIPSGTNIELLKEDFYVVREDNEFIGVIQSINIKEDISNNDELIVSGKFIENILGLRIIANQTQVNGSISNVIDSIIYDNFINPLNENRKINNLSVKSTFFSDKISTQYTGDNILAVITDMTKQSNLGFKINLVKENFDNIFLSFSLYKGINHSYSQTENPYVVFSEAYDNLDSTTYEKNTSSETTTAYVFGEGEGTDRKRTIVNDDNVGLFRKEVYIDARDLSTNNGDISEDEYFKTLFDRGVQSLVPKTEKFTGKVILNNYQFGKDFYLGDIVTIKSKYGFTLNTRVIEFLESEDENGLIQEPTFGE